MVIRYKGATVQRCNGATTKWATGFRRLATGMGNKSLVQLGALVPWWQENVLKDNLNDIKNTSLLFF